ncbi:MAG: activator of Hsp90 ATPase [Amphiamblys sp. WSBS2006]|nr:MAG: activator of Hsp90 ATPase [Amphiamblys sp. WSBS2006]
MAVDWRNVNNWHWAEKNATDSFFGLLEEKISAESGVSLAKKEGDVTITQRKGRLWVVMDVTLTLECQTEAGTVAVCVKDLTADTPRDEMEISFEKNTLTQKEKLEKKKKIEETLFNAVEGSLKEIKQKHGVEKTQKPSETPREAFTGKKEKVVEENLATTRTLQMTECFSTSLEKLYDALTNEQLIRYWTQDGTARCTPTKNGTFSLFEGKINGVFTEILPKTKLAMSWRDSTWKQNCFSMAELLLETKDKETHLRLTHKGIPSSEEKNVETVWKEHYWRRIKNAFESRF